MKIYRNIGLITILVFSFFYAERIANLTLEKNPLYQKINNLKDDYKVLAVNAEIKGDSIIPGLNGMNVNIKKSYYKMKKINNFNDFYLVYNTIIPDYSLRDYKDKIIIAGNRLKNMVAFVIDDNIDVINYLQKNSIKASVLVNINNYKYNYMELINNDYSNFYKMELVLNRNHQNTNICYVNYNIESLCRKNKKYLVKTNLIVDNNSFINIKNNINSGDLYYITSNLSLNNMKLLVNAIRFKDLDIVYLSKLISEERD